MNTITSPRVQWPQDLLRWLADLGASFSWAMEMRRRCDSELAAGRLDGETFRRIAREVDAWVGLHSADINSLNGGRHCELPSDESGDEPDRKPGTAPRTWA